MSILSKLLVTLGLDAAGYKSGLADADAATGSKLASMGDKLKSFGKKASDLGQKLTSNVTERVLDLGLASIEAASDLDESMNKVSVVFGDAADSVLAFAENAATGLGQSQQEALEAAGTFGNLFTAMGMAPDTAADMSTSLVTLGSDLASFNNAMPTEALEALRAGLSGETEPLKRFGVNLNAAAVAQKALDLGLVETSVDMVKVEGATLKLEKAQQKAAEAAAEYGAESLQAREANQAVAEAQAALDAALGGTVQELTAAQKAQAVYALVMDQTKTAQGDFARTSGGLANSIRIAKAQLGDAAATMGQQLLPIGLKVVSFVTDLVGKFTNLSPETQKTILVVAGLAAALGPVLVAVGAVSSGIGALSGILGAAGAAAGALGTSLLPIIAIVAAIVGVVVLFKKAWDTDFLGIRTTLTEFWENSLKPILTMLWEWLEVNIPLAIETLKRYWDNVLLPAIKRVWSWIETNLVPLFDALWQLLKVSLARALESLSGLWQNVLLPALQAVWQFIQDKVIPIFETVIEVIEHELGPVFESLKTNVIDPVAGAFASIGDAISGVVGWINDLIEKIQNIELPSWLEPGSPTPFELGLWGINRALKAVARNGLPELEVAVSAVGRAGEPAVVGVNAGAGMGGGDHIEIHNHGATAAALTMAAIEERRRARLNASMG